MNPVAARDAFLGIDLSTPVAIISHGGCPDGAAGAVILARALLTRNAVAKISFFEQRHSSRNTAGVSPQGTTLIFVDIVPTLEDLPALREAKQVIVIDHHCSEIETMSKVRQAVPNVLDFSCCDGTECGTSLVQAFVGDAFLLENDILHAVWRLDVFSHVVPEEYREACRGIEGWLAKDGQGNTSISLIEQLISNKADCMTVGAKLVEEVEEHTRKVFGSRRVVHDSDSLRVVLVDIPHVDGQPALCLPTYQKDIDTLQSDKPTIFATADRFVLPSGNWNISLRRAGDGIDVGAVAKLLKHNSVDGFVSGGGHPFAAGVQHRDPAVAESIIVAAMVAAAEKVCASTSTAEPRTSLKRPSNGHAEAQLPARPRFGD
jgi:hypothetical protein